MGKEYFFLIFLVLRHVLDLLVLALPSFFLCIDCILSVLFCFRQEKKKKKISSNLSFFCEVFFISIFSSPLLKIQKKRVIQKTQGEKLKTRRMKRKVGRREGEREEKKKGEKKKRAGGEEEERRGCLIVHISSCLRFRFFVFSNIQHIVAPKIKRKRKGK